MLDTAIFQVGIAAAYNWADSEGRRLCFVSNCSLRRKCLELRH